MAHAVPTSTWLLTHITCRIYYMVMVKFLREQWQSSSFSMEVSTELCFSVLFGLQKSLSTFGFRNVLSSGWVMINEIRFFPPITYGFIIRCFNLCKLILSQVKWWIFTSYRFLPIFNHAKCPKNNHHSVLLCLGFLLLQALLSFRGSQAEKAGKHWLTRLRC